jgi:outer membrane protein assembly factor BamB/predicted phosphodiesterase
MTTLPKSICAALLSLILATSMHAADRIESAPLRFAWLSDTHIGWADSAKDLRTTVHDINSLSNCSFVIISGDVTQFGSRDQFLQAKSILDGLHCPLHLIPGNHDCKWSESGATEFGRIWGSDRFVFEAGGYCFIGMHEGPVMKMGDGHFAPQDLRWFAATLTGLPAGEPVIFVTHYPLNDQLDNWFVVLDELKKFNTQAILVGHGHANVKMNFEGIPAAMGRANYHDPEHNQPRVGYTLVTISNRVMSFAERNPGRGTRPPWHTITLQKHDYASLTNHWPRPDFSVNAKFTNVTELWQFDTHWTVASSPTVADGRVFVGDASGTMRALSVKNGAPLWEFRSDGPIYSTPAVDAHRVVFASTDGNVYALRESTGRKLWEFPTAKAIVASPVIDSNTVYLGASDGIFRALQLWDGRPRWEFTGVGGFVETRPLVYEGRVIFGAWDQKLYALNATNGQLAWKWQGKSPGNLGIMYSPAAFWPVAAENKVFVVAPDRLMTALDAESGRQLWRTTTNQWPVRESIGLSEDAKRFYVRTMTNTAIVAFSTSAARPEKLWELDARKLFDYDINSAMLVEKNGELYYGTKNGLLLAIDPRSGTLLWEHKLGVTVLNTVAPLDDPDEVIVADIDGKITRVGPRQY